MLDNNLTFSEALELIKNNPRHTWNEQKQMWDGTTDMNHFPYSIEALDDESGFKLYHCEGANEYLVGRNLYYLSALYY